LYVRDIKEIAKIVTSHQNDLNFGRSQIQTPESGVKLGGTGSISSTPSLQI
jgi:hypothetical protein